MENILRDRRVYELLEKVDSDLALEAQAAGCGYCGEALHRGDYTRKPRGGPAWEKRYSFCCSRQGCRKRTTPESVRFLGRKVYAGIVVVLVSAMVHGMSGARVKRLREALGIDRRTVQHWRDWWRRSFARGRFWRTERGRFRGPILEVGLPSGLVEVFDARRREGLVKLMKFLSPITTSSSKEVMAM